MKTWMVAAVALAACQPQLESPPAMTGHTADGRPSETTVSVYPMTNGVIPFALHLERMVRAEDSREEIYARLEGGPTPTPTRLLYQFYTTLPGHEELEHTISAGGHVAPSELREFAAQGDAVHVRIKTDYPDSVSKEIGHADVPSWMYVIDSRVPIRFPIPGADGALARKPTMYFYRTFKGDDVFHFRATPSEVVVLWAEGVPAQGYEFRISPVGFPQPTLSLSAPIGVAIADCFELRSLALKGDVKALDLTLLRAKANDRGSFEKLGTLVIPSDVVDRD
jgi:hypothetical protein